MTSPLAYLMFEKAVLFTYGNEVMPICMTLHVCFEENDFSVINILELTKLCNP